MAELADDFAHRSDFPAEQDDIGAEVVQFVDFGAVSPVFEAFIEAFELAIEGVDEDEIVVDDGIEQGPEQVIDVHVAQPAFSLAKPLEYGGEDFGGGLTESDDHAGGDVEGEVLILDVTGGGIEAEEAQGDEEPVVGAVEF